METTRSAVVEASRWQVGGLITPLVMLAGLALLAQLPGLLIGDGSEDQSPRAVARMMLTAPLDTPDQNSAASDHATGRLATRAAVDW
jgi:hypothetical protein